MYFDSDKKQDRSLKPGSVLLLVGLLLSLLSHGQETMKFLKDYQGKAVYTYTKPGADYLQNYTPAEESVVKAKLESISRYLQTSPLIHSPKGNDVLITSMLSENLSKEKWCKSLRMEMNVILSPWYLKNGKPACDCSAYKVGFDLKLNHPEMAFNGRSSAAGDNVCDADGLTIYFEPQEIGEQDGCKIYDNSIIIITNGKPLWVPVTVKEYDEALIRCFEKEKEQQPEEAMVIDIYLKKIREEMATFSAEELNKPAYQSNKMGGSPEKIEGSQQLVKLNRAYFDPGKPRTAVQLIVLQCGNIGLQETGEFYFTDENSSYPTIKLAELLKSLRFSEFKKLLD
ncbi:MAG TPA: hypothetical protein PKH79_14995 [Prolixibacteraceae bacterium]|nr:hypothetical protein [Prolixibacteraceae bacterium]